MAPTSLQPVAKGRVGARSPRAPSFPARGGAVWIIGLAVLGQALAWKAPLWAQGPPTGAGELAASSPATLSYGAPEEVGMSSAVLGAGVGLYQEAVEQGEVVGAVLLVARRGTIVLHEAVGLRDRARGLPMERNTMFRMASNTKPVIATAAAILVEEDRLRYDGLVREWIPSFDNYRAGFMTLGHLLSHTSGFRINSLFLQPYSEPSSEHPDAPNLQMEVARFGAIGAATPPGESYSYSNPGYNTVGALIEIASGRPLDEFLRERIYQPLGMEDSYHHEVDEKLDGKVQRMSAVYYRRNDDGWAAGWTPGDPPQVPFVRASGGMISTAWDYALFCQTFLNGGVYDGTRILRASSVELMTSPKTEPIGGTADDRTHYGYGWSVTESGVYSHGGSDGTYAWVDPARELFGLVFTQTPNGDHPVQRFRRLVELAINDN